MALIILSIPFETQSQLGLSSRDNCVKNCNAILTGPRGVARIRHRGKAYHGGPVGRALDRWASSGLILLKTLSLFCSKQFLVGLYNTETYHTQHMMHHKLNDSDCFNAWLSKEGAHPQSPPLYSKKQSRDFPAFNKLIWRRMNYFIWSVSRPDRPNTYEAETALCPAAIGLLLLSVYS